MIRGHVILNALGKISLFVGVAMLTCLLWASQDGETVIKGFVLAAVVTIFTGLVLTIFFRTNATINFKESFAVVTLGWLVASLFGALPFLTTGVLDSFANAWFESMSGFTTTGASVFKDVEVCPRAVLFWRSLTQWLGGMGIIALFVALISNIGVRANQLFKAEVPGPISDKISPRVRETARSLWKTYVVISLLCILTFYALGMNFFDAICHAFATMATGGFSTKNASIGFYSSPWLQWAVTFFMIVAGSNFALHFLALKRRNVDGYLKNAEFKFYLAIIFVASLLIAMDLNHGLNGSLAAWEEKCRVACFQVVSILTTTGFATFDYTLWTPLAGAVLFLMMFVGGCAGSTGGCIKPGRYLIILRRSLIELRKMVHPKAVMPLRFGGKVLNEDMVMNVQQFFFLYILSLVAGMMIISALGLDFVSSLTASAACLGNIGPGFGQVGPTQNFSFLPAVGKYVLILEMLIGRLEIYPLLVLFVPAFWRR
ncbi:MAG TPA: TrkH family potassium uptake protein [Syntrophomonas sp.]|nr:TrkH family potassium uptake protein [Syntrophomonas sp.]